MNRIRVSMNKIARKKYSEVLKEFWNAVYDKSKSIDDVFERYIHEQYSQCINGVFMQRDDYIKHILQQRELMSIDKIEYAHILEKDKEVFALYYPEGTNRLNMPIKAEVIAYFRFRNEKLFKTHGQVQLLEGNLSDVDMK